MNRTAGIGALIGAVAMGAGLGITSATPALAQSGTEAAAASSVGASFEPGAKMPGNLFKPGAKLTIKRNADYERSPSATAAQPQSRIDKGETCGTEVISKTSGHGKTTLVLSVSKERAVKLSGEAGLSKGIISAKVGFDVTDIYKVTDESRYEVPKNKFGTIEAYTLFHHYRVMIFGPRGNQPVEVYKPIGVCFNQWLE
ncbi:hypothetical protein ACF07Y_38505 [Streptomyces sp. NPDC016566]|uniref:hypothetical protein n=1 Tax=Streptomyces sp. NPDC016566 TaxID=3364967 RepID=UPI0036F59E6E